jgi:hypothetical protein
VLLVGLVGTHSRALGLLLLNGLILVVLGLHALEGGLFVNNVDLVVG